MRRNGPAVIGQLPCAPGVYRFRDAGGRVLYVGRATTLRSRVASYWSDLDLANHTVSGWCSGFLVQFQISSGRVCRWSQRTCSMPGAARALAATPHAWGDFMQRTAELAAKMAQPASSPKRVPPAYSACEQDIDHSAVP